MAKSRLLPPSSGTFSSSNAPGVVFSRNYADSGIESVPVDNTAGDHHSVNAFTLNRIQVDGGRVTGKCNGWTSHDFPSRLYDNSRKSRPAYPAIPGGLDNMLFANANPDRPEILAPVFLFELRELPGLIRQLGLFNFFQKPNQRDNTIPAALWLSGNFGWAPLISDLKKLIEFPTAFARREKEIDDLHSSGGGLRRKVNLYSWSGNQNALVYDMDFPTNNATNIATGVPTRHIWGVVRYLPAKLPDGSPLRKPTPHDLRRRILGLNAASITLNVWEALPWSWLVDYFVGVSDYLGANSIGRTAIPFGGCIMMHDRCEWRGPAKASLPDATGNFFTCSAGRVLVEGKNRRMSFPGVLPTVLMNPLSGHQLSILGALKVLGARRTLNL